MVGGDTAPFASSADTRHLLLCSCCPLRYYTWVEQQGVSVEEFTARKHQSWWREWRAKAAEWDRHIEAFNEETAREVLRAWASALGVALGSIRGGVRSATTRTVCVRNAPPSHRSDHDARYYVLLCVRQVGSRSAGLGAMDAAA